MQADDVCAGKVRRGAAPPMNLPHASTGEMPSHLRDLADKSCDITFGALRGIMLALAENSAIAAAELAQRLAKRDVQVERKIVCRLGVVALAIHFHRLIAAHILPPVGHGIGNVARQGKTGVAIEVVPVDDGKTQLLQSAVGCRRIAGFDQAVIENAGRGIGRLAVRVDEVANPCFRLCRSVKKTIGGEQHSGEAFNF